jgi:putative endopeptidase
MHHGCVKLLNVLMLTIACWPALAQVSGIDTQYVDSNVRPQDDFYQYVNGKWLATIEIPPDRAAYGTASKLFDDSQKQLRAIIEAAASDASAAPASDEARIGALYRSFLDQPRIERLGIKPLAAELQRIDSVKSKRELPALIAHLQQIGVTVPYSLSVQLDSRDATRYSVDLQQDGLGLPDRDYYLREDATTLRLMRHQYQLHIAAVLARLGEHQPAQESAAIVALETELAKIQWSKSQNSDPARTYNRVELAQLGLLSPGYDWQRYLAAAGVADKVSYLIVSQPSYIEGFGNVLAQIPLPTWKAYFRWHLLADFSPYLSQAYADGAFAFFGTTLQGIPENQPRWTRAVALVDQLIGQSLGRLYVAKYFPAQRKQHAELLVSNILEAYRLEIARLDWMGAQTKTQALAKLGKLTIKIGYPDTWRDYSALRFRDEDLIGNVIRATSFEYQRNIGKLGRPLDRSDWESNPQAVNASYNPRTNEIVFPAAVLQAPFFDAAAEDAANYGGIGMVIGHEISHAFDAHGSQYDGDGNLHDWWTDEDRYRFAARTKPLVRQYAAFMPLRGRHLNGELTLDENIADNAGLTIAHEAYALSLAGTVAPVIDGLSGEQRFYMGFAQAWREKIRDSYAVELIQSDPHAISYDRVIGTLMNQPGFQDTFEVKPGDRMYLPPAERVLIW